MSAIRRRGLLWGLCLWILLVCAAARAEEEAEGGSIQLAVAANFLEPARALAADFTEMTAGDVNISFGASGQLYFQITQAAPFDIFLSADQERPSLAVTQGFAVAKSQFTYALGKLVLWSPKNLPVSADSLSDPATRALAIANPAVAPYGRAAVETLQNLGLYQRLAPKLVQGVSVAQSFQFVETGNADLGFVALSQVLTQAPETRWIVPQALYSPIRQDAVLLNPGAKNALAVQFLRYLHSARARAIIQRHGYDSGQD